MLRSESGVSAVEFALVSPLLFVLTLGIIEFGLLLFDKAVITNASREGARAAIVRTELPDGNNNSVYSPLTVPEIQSVVSAYANDYLINLGVAGDDNLTADDITVSYFDVDGSEIASPVIGGRVEVRVDFLYDFLVLPNLVRLLGDEGFSGNVNLVGTTVMRME